MQAADEHCPATGPRQRAVQPGIQLVFLDEAAGEHPGGADRQAEQQRVQGAHRHDRQIAEVKRQSGADEDRQQQRDRQRRMPENERLAQHAVESRVEHQRHQQHAAQSPEHQQQAPRAEGVMRIGWGQLRLLEHHLMSRPVEGDEDSLDRRVGGRKRSPDVSAAPRRKQVRRIIVREAGGPGRIDDENVDAFDRGSAGFEKARLPGTSFDIEASEDTFRRDRMTRFAASPSPSGGRRKGFGWCPVGETARRQSAELDGRRGGDRRAPAKQGGERKQPFQACRDGIRRHSKMPLTRKRLTAVKSSPKKARQESR